MKYALWNNPQEPKESIWTRPLGLGWWTLALFLCTAMSTGLVAMTVIWIAAQFPMSDFVFMSRLIGAACFAGIPWLWIEERHPDHPRPYFRLRRVRIHLVK